MELSERYRWSATRLDGSLLETGDNLTGVLAVMLTAQHPLLPSHTLSGLTFIRRFGRGFLYGLGGGLKEYLHCVVCEQCRIYLHSTSGAIVVTPPDYELYV